MSSTVQDSLNLETGKYETERYDILSQAPALVSFVPPCLPTELLLDDQATC